MYNNPQPQCETCGRFIAYDRAEFTNTVKQNMDGEYVLEDRFEGICEKCEEKENADETV